ncbi:MAG: hypothetical protein HY791_38985 [Deltaproteobacteria bacterium]|nr:hypothetical protein [Deltaproteobacteria bacterium]
MTRPTVMVVVAGILAACRPAVFTQVPIERDDLLIVGSIDDPGLTKIERVTDASTTLSLDLEDVGTDQVFVIRVSSADLLGPTGATLAPESAVRVGSESGCGRCLVPALDGPQVVFPGDRCPPPPRASVYLAGDEIEGEPAARIRGSVTLSFEGECACDVEVPRQPDDRVALELLYPRVDAEPMPVAADDHQSGLWLAGTNLALHIDARGARRVFGPELVPFAERPQMVQPLPDGRVIWASTIPSPQSTPESWTEFVLTDSELRPIDRVTLAMGDVLDARAAGDLVLFAGQAADRGFRGKRAALAVCRADATSLSCRNMLPDAALGFERTERVRVLDNGVIAAAGSGNALILIQSVVAPERIVDSEFSTDREGRIRIVDGSTVGLRLQHLRPSLSSQIQETLGPHLLSCGTQQVSDSRDESYVLLSSITPNLELEAEFEACIPAPGCTGITEPSVGMKRVHFSDFTYLDVRATDRGTKACPSEVSGSVDWPAGVVELRELRPGVSLYLDSFGRWVTMTATGAQQLVYGDPSARRLGGVLRRGDEFWAFDKSSAIELRTGRTLPLTGLPGHPILSAYEPEEKLTALLTSKSVRILDDEFSTVGSGETSEYLRAVAALAKGRFLVVGRDRLYAWEGELKELELSFDDPRTPGVEHRPSGCGLFEAADAKHGVGWVTGCDGLIFRVMPGPDGYSAERVAFSGRYHTGTEQRELTAVSAFCADHVWVSTDAPTGAGAWIWSVDGPELQSSLLPPGPTLSFPGHQPRSLISTSAGIVAIHSAGGASYIHTLRSDMETDRLTFADAISSVASGGGAIYFSTPSSRLGRLVVE